MIFYEMFTFMLFALGYSTVMIDFVTFHLGILFAKGLNHKIFRMFDTQLQFHMKVLCQVNHYRFWTPVPNGHGPIRLVL